MAMNQNSVISSKTNSATLNALVDLNKKYALNEIGVVMLPLSKLDIGKYQKDLNLDRVKRIVEKFDIHRMRPIDVSFRDGRYWVFDGQHRANAYYLMGLTEIPAVVHKGLTYQDEAYLFARQQDEVGSINSNHKWNALVEAGDPETMEIVKLCKDWGFTVLAKNNRGNNIKCVASLRKLYREFGPAKLATILMCIGAAWDYMEHSSDLAIIDGISRLVRVFPDFDYNRLTHVLSSTTPKMILRDMEDKHHSVRGESRRAAYQILDLYNKNLTKTKGIKRLDPKCLDGR